MTSNHTRPEFVVGIGASAGGLKSFEALLPGLPRDANTAYILLQHHSATTESSLQDILEDICPLPTRLAGQGMPVEGNTLYLCPPGTQCEVSDGCFLIDTLQEHGPRHAIDNLFSSLAQAFPEACAGIILSGTGKDGVLGLQEIKAAGGWTLVQDPATALFTGMPQNALNLHLADFVRPPDTIGDELGEIIRLSGHQADPEIVSDREKLHMLLEVMENETGFNFRRYKEPMLSRRIRRRMVANKVNTLGQYLLLAKKNSAEANLLIKDIFITVTGFFRDRKIFRRLESLLGELLKGRKATQSLRIWTAGCATGEEAYSVALLLARLTADLAEPPEIRIFATDIDPDNIRFARKGVYSPKAVENVPRELQRRYFDKTDDGWRVNAQIRDMVVFARHDATVDTPFSRLDLILCRNLLIYFSRQTQNQLLRRFHYSLNPDGYLLLGMSEGADKEEVLFKAVDRQARLYRRLETKNTAVLPEGSQVRVSPSDSAIGPVPWQQQMWELYFDEFAPAAVLVSSRLELIHVHGNVQPYLSLTEGDFNFDLLRLARPELKTDMQMVLQQAQRTGKSARSRSLKLTTEGRKRKHDNTAVSLVAIPRRGEGDKKAGKRDHRELLLIFEERQIPHYEFTGDGTVDDNEHVQALQEELAVTRDQLQSNIDALEVANQELQSVNEEFQSTMEELQSANEGFQASNEELESANEELVTVNDEISAKSKALDLVNRELETILDAALAGIIVVDDKLQVLRYSDNCRELFGLWPDNMDNIHQLMARLEGLTPLSPQLEKVLKTGVTGKLELQVGGRFFMIRLLPVSDGEKAATRRLIIAFYDETATRERALESELLAAVVRGSDDAIIVHDLKGHIRHWNDGAQQMFGYTEEEALGLKARDLVARGEKKQYEDFMKNLVAGGEDHGMEVHGLTRGGAVIDISSSASVLRDYNGNIDAVAIIFRDISDKNAIEEKLNAVVESTPDPFIIVEADGLIQRVNRQAEVLFGYNRKELTGASFKMLVPERFRKQHDVYTRNYQQKPVMRQMGAGLGLYCLTKSGEEIPVDISLSPVVAGNDTTIMVRFRDVRIERQEQAQLEDAIRQADEANRTKTRFLAAASHDLRQPLQSISMYLGALAGLNDARKKTLILDQARMAVDTSNKLLDALLNISKLESGRVQAEIESFGIDRLLERVDNTEAPQASEKQQDFTVIPSTVRVTTDPALLEQLVTNLVANAIKYSPPHSHIVLGCRRRGGMLKVQVSDNGPGIRSTELDAIFDEYRQLQYDGHYLGKGLGLGLSIVKLIAELLNLKLEVSSIPGRGSSFSVLVPVARGKPARKRSSRKASGKKAPRTGRVLLIDDDTAVLDSTSLFLDISGFTVVTAKDTEEALAALKKGLPDVIVTDYGLAQEENGIELVKRLRKKLRKKIPAIIVTGDTTELRNREARAAGCQIIAKPVEAQYLVQSLSDLLSKT